MKISYKEDIKQIVSSKYIPGTIIDSDFHCSTLEIIEKLSSIIAPQYISPHDVFDVLFELGYKPHDELPFQFKWYFKII